MKHIDYNQPPTEEFEFLSTLGRYNNYPAHWLTLQKAVMNDYFFDNHNTDDWPIEVVQEFMHKIYFC